MNHTVTGMKFVATLLLICCFQVGCSGDGALKKSAREKAEELTKATINSDFRKVGELMHPKVIAQVGGLENFIELMKTTSEGLKEHGVVIQSIDVSDATQVARNETDIFVVVPTKTVMKTPDGTTTVNSYQLGLTTVGGKNWVFVTGRNGTSPVAENASNSSRNNEASRETASCGG